MGWRVVLGSGWVFSLVERPPTLGMGFFFGCHVAVPAFDLGQYNFLSVSLWQQSLESYRHETN